MKTILLTLCTVLAARAADLEVTFSGWPKPAGRVYVSLWKQADGFPSNTSKAHDKAFAEVQGPKAAVKFSNLEPGVYAVSAFLDENGNNALDANGMKMPTEPYGFSNNARGMFGPPKFDAAKFEVKEGGNTIAITLK